MAQINQYVFDEKGMKRVIAATKKVESLPIGNIPIYRSPTGGGGGFWSKTISYDGGHKYGWERLKAFPPDDPTKPDTLDKDQPEELDHASQNDVNDRYAVEAIFRSAYVPLGQIVWMYPAPGQSYFLFDFEGRTCWGKVGADDIPGATISGDTTTLGQGNGHIYKSSGTASVSIDSDNSATTKFFNASASPVKGDKLVLVQMVGGRLVVIWEDCG